ncbi:MAG: hypothetical protein OSJ27_02210 [Candidatus Gastranaerophilales bacterium]|nr:hypothetical protein [Candidatus Gastranaerophilales bacterium]
MKKKILSLLLFLVYAFLPVSADSLKGGIEQTDMKGNVNKELFTGEIDTLEEKDTIKMTVSQVLNGTYTEEGDEFFAEITEDVLGGKRNKGIIVPKGSIVHGYVSAIEDPKNLGRDGYIVTVFDYLVTPDGRQIPIQASLSTKENVVKGTVKAAAKHVGIATAGGVVGGFFALNMLGLEAAIASHGMTLAGGAAVGGAVGLVSSMMSKGKNVNIKPGDELKIKMVTDIEIPVMSKEAFHEEDMLYEGLDVSINRVAFEKDPFDEEDIITLDLKISNMSDKMFYAFDIALMNEIKNVFYPSPFGDTSLWFKKISTGDVIIGKMSFIINDKKHKHWLVFYDRATRKPIAKYSIDNIIVDNKVNDKVKKGKKEKKSNKT